MAELPATEGFRDFAKRLGCRPSYVTQLRHAGRLVLTDDGRAVRVVESLQRIEATRDPSKAGVAARHAETRDKVVDSTEASARRDIVEVFVRAAKNAIADDITAHRDLGGDEAGSDEVDEAGAERASDSGVGYQDARAMRERYLAKSAKRDYLVSIGKLLDAEEVTGAVAAAATNLRTRFEALPDVLAPQLAAAQDEGAARAVLAEAIEHALDEASRQFSSIGKGASNV